MSFRLGLTGSIGMGKTTTAQMFRDLGHPVWNADDAVHCLYAPGGAAVQPIARAFPQALKGGGIDRNALKAVLTGNPAALDRLSAIVHPIVAADRQAFIKSQADAPIVVLDIPLLFENGYEAEMDGVAVVSADPALQRQRVLARQGMTPAMLDLILSRQMPDGDKRAKADWVIPTTDLSGAKAAVAAIVKEIASRA